MKDVFDQRDHQDVCADDPCQHRCVGNSKGKNLRLLIEVAHSFAQVAEHAGGETGLDNRRNRSGLQHVRDGVAHRLAVTRVEITSPQTKQAECGNEIGESVDPQDAAEAGVLVDEPHKRAGEHQPGLHGNEDGGIRANKLPRGNQLLYKRIDSGPVNGRTGSVEKHHRVDLPELRVAGVDQPGATENQEAAGEVEIDSEIAAFVFNNKEATEKGNNQSRQGIENYR